MGAVSSSRKSPNFVVADSAIGLRRLMRSKQTELKVQLKWHIMMGPDNRFYAWYEEDELDRFNRTGEID